MPKIKVEIIIRIVIKIMIIIIINERIGGMEGEDMPVIVGLDAKYCNVQD